MTRRARISAPSTAVLLYTGYGDRALLSEGLDAGVTGFVLKEAPIDDLLRAVRSVAAGGTYIDPVLAGTLAGTPSGAQAGGADPAGARRSAAARRRTVQRGDREQAVHLGGDGSLARAQGDGQARCGHADAGGRPGAARPVDRLTRAPSTRPARRCGAIRARGCGRGRSPQPRRRRRSPTSVHTSPETSPSDAPAVTSRAAAIPWVSGRQRPTALIQPGRT